MFFSVIERFSERKRNHLRGEIVFVVNSFLSKNNHRIPSVVFRCGSRKRNVLRVVWFVFISVIRNKMYLLCLSSNPVQLLISWKNHLLSSRSPLDWPRSTFMSLWCFSNHYCSAHLHPSCSFIRESDQWITNLRFIHSCVWLCFNVFLSTAQHAGVIYFIITVRHFIIFVKTV